MQNHQTPSTNGTPASLRTPCSTVRAVFAVAESGALHYVLSGDEAEHATYEAARALLAPKIGALERGTVDNAPQKPRVAALRNAVERFTSELEAAITRGEADVAVHSTKDLPGDMPDGLVIGGYLPRADTRDVLVLRAGVEAPDTLATGSPRRRMQVRRLFPDVAFSEIRGNVDTRLRKIGEQHVADGTILAAAGLKRLGIETWPALGIVSSPLRRPQCPSIPAREDLPARL